MSRQAKQILAAQARKAAESDSFVSTLLLSDLKIDTCTPEQFLEIVSHLDELCANRVMDQRPAYVEQVYHRLLHLLSRKVEIQSDRIVAMVKQFVTYHPAMSILTLDDLKHFQVEMEKRSVIIHFDMSGSMSGSGFAPLRQTVITLSGHLCSKGVQVYISLFGGKVQESVHEAIGGRLLTFDEFTRGDYQPSGGTAFCPSFERTRQFPSAYDAIIISDGEFTDDMSRLTFQEDCKTVFFVAPPWSPSGIEQKHAKTIASCVHSNVPYVGVASEKYPQLDRIIEEFLREHHSFARLPGFITVGTYSIPTCLLAPTQMMQVFQNCFAQGDTQLQAFVKKIIGLFRYLEETAKLNFERCIRGEEFRSLMSLATPLSKCAQAHLETSEACQQLYGYLANILNHFSHQQQKLTQSLSNDLKAKTEVSKLWDAAMSFSERELIIDENDRKYGPSIGCLNLNINSLTCTAEMLSEALQQLKTLYAPENLDLLVLILDLLATSNIDDGSATAPKELRILIWRKADGTVDLMSILRQLPVCLQQLQHSRGIEQDRTWTLQPLAAIRLAWLMDALGQLLPEFIVEALPALVVSNRFLIDLDQNENRSAFWMKIIRQLAPKIGVTLETLELIHQILTAHALKSFLLRVTDGSITYEKQVYGNALPFIDTDEPMAWCVFTNEDGHRVDALTGSVTERPTFITDPKEVAKYYEMNLGRHGSVVRPRYLSLLDYSALPDGAIELYGTATRKDVDILRDQLLDFGLGAYSSDQINAHIYTIRDRLTSISCVLWGSTDLMIETVARAKATCQGASVPLEQVTIAIPRSVVVDYLISHSNDPFVAGALRGLSEYARMASQQASATIKELEYAIECGQKANTSTTVSPDVPFIHLDKPGVHQYLAQEKSKLTRSLRSIMLPPQLQSMPALLPALRQTMINDEVLGMLDLELLPSQSNSTRPVNPSPRVALSKDLFTCPITLDIMENPATTTPCGHMFELDAINAHLRASGNICPICRGAVTNAVPNYAFKNVIEVWSAQQQE